MMSLKMNKDKSVIKSCEKVLGIKIDSKIHF